MGNYCQQFCDKQKPIDPLINNRQQNLMQPHMIKSEKIKKPILKYQDDFKQIKILAKNPFGAVIQVKKKNEPEGKSYALKTINKSKIKQKNLLQTEYLERGILSSHNDFLVDILYIFQSEKMIFIVMEYVQKQDLYYFIKNYNFNEDMIRMITAEVVEGLSFLHNKNIIYRDLKPENILVTKEGHVKLTDFSLSMLQNKNKLLSTFNGILQYMAPELFEQNLKYDKSVDLWALGVFLYQIKHKITPFFSDNQLEIKKKILDVEYQISQRQKPSIEYKDLIQKLLIKNPAERLSLQKIKQHPFFSKINWQQIKSRQNCNIDFKNIIQKTNINWKGRKLLQQTTRMNMNKPQKSKKQFVLNLFEYTYESTENINSTPAL